MQKFGEADVRNRRVALKTELQHQLEQEERALWEREERARNEAASGSSIDDQLVAAMEKGSESKRRGDDMALACAAIEAEAAKAAEAAANAPAESASGGAAAGGGAGVEVNGVFIAQTWLDKSAAARARILG